MANFLILGFKHRSRNAPATVIYCGTSPTEMKAETLRRIPEGWARLTKLKNPRGSNVAFHKYPVSAKAAPLNVMPEVDETSGITPPPSQSVSRDKPLKPKATVNKSRKQKSLL